MGVHVSKSARAALKGVARFLQGRAVVGDGMMGDVVAALLLATEAGRLADFYKVVSEWMTDNGLMDRGQ